MGKKLNTAQEKVEVGREYSLEEAIKLIEAGFQYVTTIEGTQLFKKPK
jgi:hypothetical protein